MAKKKRRKEPPARRKGLTGLKAQREKAGLTQRELADKVAAEAKVSVDKTAVSHWENGRGSPSWKLPIVAQVLGCSIDDLYREAS